MKQHSDLPELPASKHREILQALATGERSSLDGVVVQLREGCTLCSSRMQEQAELQLLLDEEGERQRDELLGEALKQGGFPGDELTGRVLLGLASESAGGGAASPSWMTRVNKFGWLLGLAATLALCVVLWPKGEGDKPVDRGTIRMGAEEEEADFGPTEASDDWDGRLWWNDPKPPKGWFNLYVWDRDSGAELLHEEDLEEPEWTIDPKQRSSLTGSLRVQVEVVGASGQRSNGSSWFISLESSAD